MEKKLAGERYSYSTFKLFLNSGIEKMDKIFILYRYNMINILNELYNFFKQFCIEIDLANIIKISSKKFIRKIYAIEITMIGRDILNSNTEFMKKIKESIDKTISNQYEDFFVVNRKIRNNIHYLYVEEIDESYTKDIVEIQNEYMKLVENYIINKMNFKIEQQDIIITKFFRKCIELKITEKEMKENYENYYIQFYFTGTIKRIK